MTTDSDHFIRLTMALTWVGVYCFWVSDICTRPTFGFTLGKYPFLFWGSPYRYMYLFNKTSGEMYMYFY